MTDTPPKTQPLFMSCKSCDRMTKIEGEVICYKEGSVVSLTQSPPSLQSDLLCHHWKLGKLAN